MTKSTRPASNRSNPVRTIPVVEADIAAARRLLSLLADISRATDDGASLVGCDPNSGPDDGARARAQAASALALRRNRLKALGRFAAEPAFLILLAIYVSDETAASITPMAVSKVAALSQATLIRWLDELEHANWIARTIDESDRRQSHIRLARKARRALDSLFGQSDCGLLPMDS